MSVGEFTASSIALQEDVREGEKGKGSTIDHAKLMADVEVQVAKAKAGQLHEAVEGLLALEKSCRAAEDIGATRACCSALLDALHAAGQWGLLQEHVVTLAKRRGQLKQVIVAFVRQAMGYVDGAPDQATRVALIQTLQAVTEGKIFVEIERARLSRKLAAVREAEGNIAEAAEILQEVAVETYGAMAKTEKIAFILEQMRLCLDKGDFPRAQILSRKISPKAFVERKGEAKGDIGIEGTAIEAPDEGIPGLGELKLTYYRQMVRYHAHSKNYIEMCRAYRSMYETETIANDAEAWPQVLRKMSWLLVLAPAYSTPECSASDRATLLAAVSSDKRLAELPSSKALLALFTGAEIIPWRTFQAQHGGELAAEVAALGAPVSTDAAADLRLRVTEHNVLVAAKYYARLSTARLGELLDMTPDEAERQLAELVVAKAIAAKIDRPGGVVHFGARPAPEDVLNKWSGSIGRLLGLVDKCCQQIQKEAMVHRVSLAPQGGHAAAQQAAGA